MRRTLILLGKRPRPDLRARVAAGEEPRAEYMALADRLGAEVVDYGDAERSRHPLVRALGRALGPRWALAALGAVRHGEFDVLYATGEDVGLPLALLLRTAGVAGKLAIVMHNGDTPRRALVLRAAGARVFRGLVCLCAEQVRALTGRAGLPPALVRRLPCWTDVAFYRPGTAPPDDFLLAVGMEARDYATLLEAARGLPYRVHVVASGWSPDAGYAAASGVAGGGNVVVERDVPATHLRALYARARLVVVPLHAVSYAAGVTTVLEAMAMAKPLVVSDSPGIRDYVVADVSALVVPVGDAAALRAAIERLWGDGDARARMGRHNRRWAERDFDNEAYADRVHALLAGAGARPPSRATAAC
jgi:glycosyltransferase involved in cell wall biosynthesis